MKLFKENCLILFIIISLQAEANGVTIDVDTSKAPNLANFASIVKQTLITWYPMVSDALSSPNFSPPNTIQITFDPNYGGVAYAYGNRIVGSAKYYTDHQDDVGSMIHEMTHVIQSYKNCPSWLVEGIADWIRYYQYEPSRRIPSKQRSSDSYNMGYGTSAYFLQYIIDNTPQWQAPNNMVYWANKDCREGYYNDSMWPRMTGKTLDQLWQDMIKSTAVVPAGVSPQFGCYKDYCRSWCYQKGSGNWCYTTRGQKNDHGWVKCSSKADCNENWQCANECHPKDYTK